MPSPHAIEVEHLYKHYADLAAVEDLSFTVSTGRCTAFLGPNGAGKTTTIKTLYGKAIADTRPETRIRVLGFELPRQELEVKSLSGLVPQDNSLDDELDVEQNLSIFARFYHMPRKKALARIGELLAFMELSEKRHNRVKELSGGMKRRLIIARALLGAPRLLVLDEPTTGLDPQVRHLIWDRMRLLMNEGVTILLTTHYMEEAFQIADDIIIMDRGRKVLQGAPRTLMAEHIETHVLEVHDLRAIEEDAGAQNRLAALESSGRLRRDASSTRVLLYASDPDALEAVSRALRPGSFLLRATNLEDLFLKTTGRKLNE
jgi:lipooligosaccharide transport system ATP-binding protein